MTDKFIRPAKGKVLAQPIEEQRSDVLYVQDKTASNKAVILKVGEGVLDVAVGDVILFVGADVVQSLGEKILIIDEDQILGVLEE